MEVSPGRMCPSLPTMNLVVPVRAGSLLTSMAPRASSQFPRFFGLKELSN